jgi:hypothetical protein
MKEGVEWKDGFASQFVNATGPSGSAYKSIYSGKGSATDIFSLSVKDLKNAFWYHLRLLVEYMGVTVHSEARNFHTSRSGHL